MRHSEYEATYEINASVRITSPAPAPGRKPWPPCAAAIRPRKSSPPPTEPKTTARSRSRLESGLRGEESDRVPRDDGFFVGRDDADFDLRARSRDSPLSLLERVVGGAVELETEHFESLEDRGTDRRGGVGGPAGEEGRIGAGGERE